MLKQIITLLAACCLLQGGSVAIGAVMGSIYYTEEGSDYRVVATLSTSSDSTPVRVIARLRPGQIITLSVPGLAGAQEQAVSLIRTGNRLMISDAGAHSVATN